MEPAKFISKYCNVDRLPTARVGWSTMNRFFFVFLLVSTLKGIRISGNSVRFLKVDDGRHKKTVSRGQQISENRLCTSMIRLPLLFSDLKGAIGLLRKDIVEEDCFVQVDSCTNGTEADHDLRS